MTRLNVYLPDDLAAQAKQAELNVSALTQEAIRRVLRQRSTDSMAVVVARGPKGVTHDRVLEALDQAREEPPTRHG